MDYVAHAAAPATTTETVKKAEVAVPSEKKALDSAKASVDAASKKLATLAKEIKAQKVEVSKESAALSKATTAFDKAQTKYKKENDFLLNMSPKAPVIALQTQKAKVGTYGKGSVTRVWKLHSWQL